MKIFYSIGILSYALGIRLAAPFSTKAKLWLSGRKNWQSRLPKKADKLAYWFHCASLGEFEQARPLMEYYAEQGKEIYLSFFSPSGYEQKKNWKIAKWVGYLPLDSAEAARIWLDALNPEKVFFVKYEFWFHYLNEVNTRQIPLYLISARFREDQAFFKWYGSVYREMLGFYTHIFTQDANSVKLLKSVGIKYVTHAGDTRFDRVLQLPSQKTDLPLIASFCHKSEVGILGSSWPEEENLLKEAFPKYPNFKWIIVPHDISESHLEKIEASFPSKTIRYSKFDGDSDQSILIVDSIGILSQAYAYAQFALIGGGFSNALHNILEAAVWGIPVLYGDNIKKYPEGKGLSEAGGGFMIQNSSDFIQQLESLSNPSIRNEIGAKAKTWVEQNAGATKRILKDIL